MRLSLILPLISLPAAMAKFSDSCNDFHYRGSYLIATCQDDDAEWSDTSIDLKNCLANTGKGIAFRPKKPYFIGCDCAIRNPKIPYLDCQCTTSPTVKAHTRINLDDGISNHNAALVC